MTETTTMIENNESITPVRRGRKRIHTVETEPKKRGRKPKIVADNIGTINVPEKDILFVAVPGSELEIGQVIQKKRGRPRINPDQSIEVAEKQEQVSETTTPRRGRPRLKPVEPQQSGDTDSNEENNVVVVDANDNMESKEDCSCESCETPRDVLQFHYVVSDNIEIEADLNKLLKIPEYSDLTPSVASNILAEASRTQARWSVFYNAAAFEYEQTKIAFDVWVAKEEEKTRSELLEKGEKDTGKHVTNIVLCKPEYIKKQRELITLKLVMNNIKAGATGFASKGDKASTISYLLKRELKNIKEI